MLDNNPTYPNRRGQAMADQREFPGSYEEANRINRPPNQYGPGNTFLGVPSGSLRDPASLASARAVILGAPFDAGTSFRPGARFGPRAIRSTDYIPHSGYRPHLALRVDPLSKLGVVDIGDVNMPQLDSEGGLGSTDGRLSTGRRRGSDSCCARGRSHDHLCDGTGG